MSGLTLLEIGGRSGRCRLFRGPCTWVHTHVTRLLRAYPRIPAVALRQRNIRIAKLISGNSEYMLSAAFNSLM